MTIRIGPRRRDINSADPGYRDPQRPRYSWLRLVIEPEMRRRLAIEAEQEGVSMSEIVRRACRAYFE